MGFLASKLFFCVQVLCEILICAYFRYFSVVFLAQIMTCSIGGNKLTTLLCFSWEHMVVIVFDF